MNKSILNTLNQKGFTLIEMAIVMVIGGILLSFMGSALLTYLKKSRIQKTEYRIEAIKESLAQYLSVNRRYPCPARRDIAPGVAPAAGTTGFGQEVGTNCQVNYGGVTRTAAVANTIVPAISANQSRVQIGSVPTRTLNLPDEFAMDGWGNRFSYAVTAGLASVGGGGTLFQNNGGTISIADTMGVFRAPTGANPTGAHYVVVSHGTTGEGAFSLAGNQVQPCTSGSLDNQNCNNSSTFLTTLVNSDANTANFYDDYFYYQGQTVPLIDPIPSGAVMAFNLPTCPANWSPYDLAEGKVVIGMDNISGAAAPAGYPEIEIGIGGGSSAGTYPISVDVASPVAIDLTREFTTTQADTSGMPPYVALLYCERD